MFGERELAQVNPAYFNIIVVTDMDVTVQSKNSEDYWYLHCTGYPNEESCIIFISIDTVIPTISMVMLIA